MGEFSVRSFRLNILSSVGAMNETKINKIQECLGHDFQSITTVEQTVFIANPSKKCIFIINPQQITFGMDGEDIDVPDFEYIQNKLSTLMIGLLIDPVVRSGVQIVAHYSTSGSSMDESFKFLAASRSLLSEGIKNVAGVGLRFILAEEGDTWEYKVEPFIKDPSHYFLEAICGNKVLPLETILIKTKQAYTYFTNDWKETFEEHLLAR